MAQRSRGYGEKLPEPGALLRELGEARRAVIQATTRVRPFGTTYHALHMVVTAIDTLAYYLTGQQHYYALGGSVPPPGDPLIGRARPDDGDEPDDDPQP